MDDKTAQAFQSLAANVNAWTVVWKYLCNRDQDLAAETVLAEHVNDVLRGQGAARESRQLLLEISNALQGVAKPGGAVSPTLL